MLIQACCNVLDTCRPLGEFSQGGRVCANLSLASHLDVVPKWTRETHQERQHPRGPSCLSCSPVIATPLQPFAPLFQAKAQRSGHGALHELGVHEESNFAVYSRVPPCCWSLRIMRRALRKQRVWHWAAGWNSLFPFRPPYSMSAWGDVIPAHAEPRIQCAGSGARRASGISYLTLDLDPGPRIKEGDQGHRAAMTGNRAGRNGLEWHWRSSGHPVLPFGSHSHFASSRVPKRQVVGGARCRWVSSSQVRLGPAPHRQWSRGHPALRTL